LPGISGKEEAISGVCLIVQLGMQTAMLHLISLGWPDCIDFALMH